MRKVMCTNLEHVKTIRGLVVYLTEHFKKEFVLDGTEHYVKLGVKKHDDSVPTYFIEFGYFGFELVPDGINQEIAEYLQEVLEFITISNRDDWFKEPQYFLVIMRNQDGNCMYLSKSNVSDNKYEIGYGNEESACGQEDNQFTEEEVHYVIEYAAEVQRNLGYPSRQLEDLIKANKVEIVE